MQHVNMHKVAGVKGSWKPGVNNAFVKTQTTNLKYLLEKS